MLNTIENSYVTFVLVSVGITAVITAIIVAYPALSFLAAKLFC